jgi:hypothetical protein
VQNACWRPLPRLNRFPVRGRATRGTSH